MREGGREGGRENPLHATLRCCRPSGIGRSGSRSWIQTQRAIAATDGAHVAGLCVAVVTRCTDGRGLEAMQQTVRPKDLNTGLLDKDKFNPF